MNRKTGLLLFVFLLQLNAVFAQLNPGEKAPEIIFEKSFPSGYQLPKGKPIILDFWATWCAPCIAALYESNNIIDKYRDQIIFLGITDSTSKNVEEFIKKNKFKHQFLLNNNQSTFRSYNVKGLPTAFLIDANGIIQWSGHGMSVNSKLLDEFLKTGKVAANSESKSLSFSSIQKGAGDFYFDFTEITSGANNAFPGVAMAAKADSISYAIENIPLRGIIELLYKNQAKQIIYHLKDQQQLKKVFTLNVNAKNVDIKTVDFTLLKMIGNKQDFKFSIKDIDTLAWVFKIVDLTKFNDHKTVIDLSMGNSEDFNFHIGEDNNGQTTLTAINLKLIDFQASVSEYFDSLIIFNNIDPEGFDFENISLNNFETFKIQMLDKYGLKLVKEKATIPFLIIDHL